MQNTVKLYGVVEGYEKISFVLDKFKCVFFNADPIPRSSVILPQHQGFILGHLSMIFNAKWQNFCIRKILMPALV